MDSISFPNIFNNLHTNTVSDRDATKQNMRLILASNLGKMFGDPGYGSDIKRVMFEQNDIILKDVVIDSIYTTLTTFMPQIYTTRKWIDVSVDRDSMRIQIKYQNIIDKQIDTYNLDMTKDNIEER